MSTGAPDADRPPSNAGSVDSARALVAAISAGLPESAARFWAQREAIRDLDGVLTIVEELDRPAAATPTLRATPLSAERVADAANWSRYAAKVQAMAGDRRVTVRLPWPQAKAVIDLGAKTLLLRVELTPDAFAELIAAAEDSGRQRLTVTCADEEPAGWAFVGSLLVDSLRQGMPDTKFDAAAQCEWLEGFLRVGLPGGAVGWVARFDGQVCGTGAARPHTDPVLRRVESELVDTYTFGPHRRAAQDALLAATARWAASVRPGAPLVSKIVGEDGGELRILAGLEAAGWRASWALMLPA